MYFTGEGKILFALLLFIVSNIGFQSGLTFYDAFISDIVDEPDYNRVSGFGYAIGYIGSFAAVLMVFFMKDSVGLMFVVTAIFFAVFSLPLFLFVKEKKYNDEDKKLSLIDYIKFGFKKVANTIRHINKYKNLKNFLISFFLYIDAINTIIFFSGIYASKTLNFSMTQLAIFFVIVQLTAMLGSFLFGSIGDRLGIKNSIFITLVIWTAIVFFIFFFVNEKSVLQIGNYEVHYFYIVGGFAGTFLGATQALSRTLMTKLTPPEIKTEFFGFYSLFDKTSTLLGPLTFGLVSMFTGSQKLAILSIGIFFLLGMYTLKAVKEK